MRLRLAAAALALAACAAQAQSPQPPALAGRAFLLADLTSGQVLAAHQADERVEPASLTKLMTAYLVFGAMREGRLAPEQEVQVSAGAGRGPGVRSLFE
jgi:serine-type D-Ala-D-Ala carboxypeptidase (penicillin-binding protein 5/6)